MNPLNAYLNTMHVKTDAKRLVALLSLGGLVARCALSRS